MNCPICGKPLEVEVVDDRDKNIAMATIECSGCPSVNTIITWPFGQEKGVLVATPTEVVALG